MVFKWKRWKDKSVEEKCNSCFWWFRLFLVVFGVKAFFELVQLFGLLLYYRSLGLL